MRFFCLLMKTVAATMAQEHDGNRLKIDLFRVVGSIPMSVKKIFIVKKILWKNRAKNF